MSSRNTFTPDPKVVFTKLDDEAGVLLHLDTRRYYSLNETGIKIWEHLGNGADVSRIASTLASEYNITAEEAAAYVQQFVDELRQDELIHVR